MVFSTFSSISGLGDGANGISGKLFTWWNDRMLSKFYSTFGKARHVWCNRPLSLLAFGFYFVTVRFMLWLEVEILGCGTQKHFTANISILLALSSQEKFTLFLSSPCNYRSQGVSPAHSYLSRQVDGLANGEVDAPEYQRGHIGRQS